MADKTDPKDDTHESFKDSGKAIGQKADGTLDIFDLSELPARIAERDRQEAAWAAAMAGDGADDDDEEGDDISDEELAAMMDEPAGDNGQA